MIFWTKFLRLSKNPLQSSQGFPICFEGLHEILLVLHKILGIVVPRVSIYLSFNWATLNRKMFDINVLQSYFMSKINFGHESQCGQNIRKMVTFHSKMGELYLFKLFY